MNDKTVRDILRKYGLSTQGKKEVQRVYETQTHDAHDTPCTCVMQHSHVYATTLTCVLWPQSIMPRCCRSATTRFGWRSRPPTTARSLSATHSSPSAWSARRSSGRDWGAWRIDRSTTANRRCSRVRDCVHGVPVGYTLHRAGVPSSFAELIQQTRARDAKRRRTDAPPSAEENRADATGCCLDAGSHPPRESAVLQPCNGRCGPGLDGVAHSAAEAGSPTL